MNFPWLRILRLLPRAIRFPDTVTLAELSIAHLLTDMRDNSENLNLKHVTAPIPGKTERWAANGDGGIPSIKDSIQEKPPDIEFMI